MGWIYLWEFKEKCKTKREYFEAWLRMATKKKDLYMMRKLIEEENVDPNAKNAEEGSNCIHIAAAQRDATTLRFFLSLTTKINLNAQDKYGETPLIIATISGWEEVVQILLAQPSLDVNMTDKDGRTALMLACLYGQKTILSMLLGHEHIQVNKAEFVEGETALIMAVNEPDRDPELVRLLLTRDDINVNAQDKDKCTALMYSCTYGNLEIVRILLEHRDIDVNLTDFKNKNALVCACKKIFERPGEVEVISMMLQREEIQMSSSNIEAVVFFIMHRDMNIKDKRTMRLVIDEAVSQNLLDIARWLLKIEGYLFKAVSLGPLRRRSVKGVKNKRI